MALRRVVTGQNRDGRSVFVTDERHEPVTAAMMPEASSTALGKRHRGDAATRRLRPRVPAVVPPRPASGS